LGPRRESTDRWEHALNFAKESVEAFERPYQCIEDIEKNGKDALALLSKRQVFFEVLIKIYGLSYLDNSVRAIDRYSRFTGPDDEPQTEKLAQIGHKLVTQWHETKLQVGNLTSVLCFGFYLGLTESSKGPCR
jgi:hypothetical protein